MNTLIHRRLALAFLVLWVGCLATSGSVLGQSDATAPGAPEAGFSQEELQRLNAPSSDAPAADTVAEPASFQNSLNFLALLIEGGPLMIPIAMMSLLVVAVAMERFVALRRSRLLPRALRREIRRAGDQPPRATMTVLYAACTRYRSAAGRILQDVVLKAGRPIPEAERCISEGTQREADFLYGNVRWLTMAAAVTPLIGLLGTVWGMIIAFYNTTKLGAGMNKAEFLAEGIYVALVTTLGGLAVAIPAAIFAHYFEGRITRILALIDDECRSLLPVLEKLEGRGRFDPASQEFKSSPTSAPPGPPAMAEPPQSKMSARRDGATPTQQS